MDKEKLNQEIEKELKIKENELKMLSGTINELIERGENWDAIFEMKKMVDEKAYEIKEMKKYLSNPDDGNVEYEYYLDDDRRQNVLKQNLFNKIKKPQNNKPCVVEPLKKGKEKEGRTLTNKYVEEINKTADLRVMSNRFIVDLSAIGVNEIMVEKVDFLGENSMLISIYDHVAEFFGRKTPIIATLSDYKTPFDFTISKLDSNGNLLYKENYSHAKINTIYKGGMNYNNVDFSTIALLIDFEEVNYETTE